MRKSSIVFGILALACDTTASESMSVAGGGASGLAQGGAAGASAGAASGGSAAGASVGGAAAPTAGAGGSGGTGLAGGGSGGSAGTAAAGGAHAGSGGGAGAGAGGGGAGGPGEAAALQGLTIQVLCGTPANQMRSCNYIAPANQNCGSNQVRTYADATVKMGGTPGTVYDVTLRIRGIVEANEYTGGTSDQNGFYAGGQPGGQGGPQYSQYSLEVSAPQKIYHLNQLDPGAQQDKYKNPKDGSVVHHFGFVIDYRETIKIEGGATVSLKGKDNDCLMGRNCEPPANDFGRCTLQKLPDLTEAQVPQGASGYDGNFVWIDVESSAVSK